MSVTVIKPSLTHEIIVQIFNRLVEWEVRSKLDDCADMRQGQQDGYITCLIDMLGADDSENLEIAASDGKTCFDIVDRISTELLIKEFDAVETGESHLRSKIISDAVARYIKDHTFEVIESLRFL